jgi:hypothetical protein
LPIPKSLQALPVDPLGSSDLRKIINQWIEIGWTPKSTEAAQAMLTVLSQLHQFYWLQLNKGMAVDQSDLDHIKSKLMAARDIAAKFTEFFDRLLATEDLWDARKSAEYMLADCENPGEYVSNARSVSEALKISTQTPDQD